MNRQDRKYNTINLVGEAHPSDALKCIPCYKNVADMFMCVPNKNCYCHVIHFLKMSLALISKA